MSSGSQRGLAPEIGISQLLYASDCIPLLMAASVRPSYVSTHTDELDGHRYQGSYWFALRARVASSGPNASDVIGSCWTINLHISYCHRRPDQAAACGAIHFCQVFSGTTSPAVSANRCSTFLSVAAAILPSRTASPA